MMPPFPTASVYAARPLAPKMREGEPFRVTTHIISPSLFMGEGFGVGERVQYSTGGVGLY